MYNRLRQVYPNYFPSERLRGDMPPQTYPWYTEKRRVVNPQMITLGEKDYYQSK